MLRSIQVSQIVSDGSACELKYVRYMKKLKRFTLKLEYHKIKQSRMIAFHQYVKYFEGLEELNFGGCHHVHDIALVDTVIQCKSQLLCLEFEYLHNMMSSTIPRIIQHCLNLTTLIVNHCENMTIDPIPLDPSRPYPLTELNLTQCRDVSEVSVMYVLRVCPALSVIDLTDAKMMKNQIVSCIAEHCPALQVLSVSGCNYVDLKPVQDLAKRLHKENAPLQVTNRNGGKYRYVPKLSQL
jgi:Leucine-rich repeat (LRR) protein